VKKVSAEVKGGEDCITNVYEIKRTGEGKYLLGNSGQEHGESKKSNFLRSRRNGKLTKLKNGDGSFKKGRGQIIKKEENNTFK